MAYSALVKKISEDPAITKVVGRSVSALAVAEQGRAAAIAGIAAGSERKPILVAVPTTAEADRLVNDLSVLLGPNEVIGFPAWETLPFERVSPSVKTMGLRCETLHRLSSESDVPTVVVASIKSLLQKLIVTSVSPIQIEQGNIYDLGTLVESLVTMGYRREPQVEHRGEISVRGSILDIFPSTHNRPIRLDLWGDQLDRLCEFSVNSQRSQTDLSSINIFPCREVILNEAQKETASSLSASEPWGKEHWQRLSEGELFDGMESWLPWFVPQGHLLTSLISSDGLVCLVEPTRLKARSSEVLAEEADLGSSLARTWMQEDATKDFPKLHTEFNNLLKPTEAHVVSISNVAADPSVAVLNCRAWGTPGEQIQANLVDISQNGSTLIVSAEGAGSATKIKDTLTSWGINLIDAENTESIELGQNNLIVSHVERGFIFSESGVALLTEFDLSGRRRSHRRAKVKRNSTKGHFDDLKKGDYVVHHQHGVGKYCGMVTRAIGGMERDYLLLAYKGDDKLYLPSDQIDLIRRFSTGDQPKLHRLGGSDFAKAKAKVRSAVEEIAQELVVLYQKRITTKGFVFSPDSPWQSEIEDAFEFDLTPDQASAVIDIKSDMESDVPMDRLVVGDVGFGKTEVALRAAFKATQDAKQVAILVPTTLLAQQHYQTFSDRFAPYPLRVEVLSRFLTAAQAKVVVDGLESGDVDVVIGTHRLLSKDIKFKDLGLLVVDEEQRFGVTHKERIKELKAEVDILTLSATPIPRTLEMSLTGIRDLSLLNTPPADRQPILTYVGEYDEKPVAEAIRRELLREGQVFYVHNRVRSIEKVAQELRNLVPEARVAVAHGQMDEATLEKVVVDFWEHEFDVLVCTTIIESGIDMPSVNTLVIDRSELLGLGQLHQLRGRVGRSGQRAYAYLFTREDSVLTQEAYERLRTIGESTELGSGFKIAMRDLEIRGAGNLLGSGQSGHIASVGYDLYCQMVTDAVSVLKGEAPENIAEIKVDIPVDAHIPEAYISGEAQRIEAYRSLADVAEYPEIEEIEKSWIDRFGSLPNEAKDLLKITHIKSLCRKLDIEELVVSKGPGFGGPEFIIKLGPLDLKVSKQIRLDRLYRGNSSFNKPYSKVGSQFKIGIKNKNILDEILKFFESMFEDEN